MKMKLAFSRASVAYALGYLLWVLGVLVWKYGTLREIQQGVYTVSQLWWKYACFAIILTLWALICWTVIDRTVRRSTIGAIAANCCLFVVGLAAIAFSWQPNGEFWLRQNAFSAAGRYFFAELGIIDFSFIVVPLLTLGSCLLMWLRRRQGNGKHHYDSTTIPKGRV